VAEGKIVVTNKAYQIQGMHCQSCVQKITDALKGLVGDVQVTLNPPRAIVRADTLPDLSALNAAIAIAGNYTLKEELPAPQLITAPIIEEEQKSWLATYYPLFLIIGMISIVSLKGASGLHGWMLHFMAGFFIVFSFFKLLDLNSFRDAYATYDLLAKRWNGYGYVYPFLELGLGLAFLFQYELLFALYYSIALMGFSSLGVIQALREKRKIRCACLGTVLNLPMSTITLVEDLGMVGMSVLMLLAMYST
jgi:copper chaperone CopZ